jgi:hypothetical protein
MLPALLAGFALGVIAIAWSERPLTQDAGLQFADVGVRRYLPLIWTILYGCALHAAGFYTTRGMRLFGYVLIAGGCGGLLVAVRSNPPSFLLNGWFVMGFFFGLLHLAYGVYLYFTEPRRTDP